MLYFVKNSGRKYAFDTISGAIVPLTSLENKMLCALEPPLEKLCPTSLRYELAKYDSDDVSEAYARIYSLYTEGIILGEGDKMCIQIDGSYAPESFEVAKAALDIAFAESGVSHSFEVVGNSTIKNDIITYINGLK